MNEEPSKTKIIVGSAVAAVTVGTFVAIAIPLCVAGFLWGLCTGKLPTTNTEP